MWAPYSLFLTSRQLGVTHFLVYCWEYVHMAALADTVHREHGQDVDMMLMTS